RLCACTCDDECPDHQLCNDLHAGVGSGWGTCERDAFDRTTLWSFPPKPHFCQSSADCDGGACGVPAWRTTSCPDPSRMRKVCPGTTARRRARAERVEPDARDVPATAETAEKERLGAGDAERTLERERAILTLVGQRPHHAVGKADDEVLGVAVMSGVA